MENLSLRTGLSVYCLDVLLASHVHTWCNRKPTHQALAELVCRTEPRLLDRAALDAVVVGTAGSETKRPSDMALRKQLVQTREEELGRDVKAGRLSAAQKDETLVREFLAWGQTQAGHFVYVYRCGLDTTRLDSWQLVDRTHLGLFHRRLNKDALQQMLLLDKASTPLLSDQQTLGVDMRHVVNHWLASAAGQTHKQALHDFAVHWQPCADYLLTQHQQPLAPLAHPPTTATERKTVKRERTTSQPQASRSDAPTAGGELPWDATTHYVGAQEYAQLQTHPLGNLGPLAFQDFIDMSQRGFLGADAQPEPSYFEHDPLVAVRALLLALQPEALGRQTLTEVCERELRVVRNGSVTALLDQLLQSATACDALQDGGAQWLWASMMCENLSCELSPRLRERLGAPVPK